MDHTFLIWLALVPVLLWGQIYLLGRKMSEPEKMIRPIQGGLTPDQYAALAGVRDWLAAVGLEFRTSFQFGAITVAVFQQANLPRFFSIMFHQRLTFAAESYLEDLTILDTGTSGSMGLFPRPGAYAQSFPKMSPQEAWQRHIEAEAHLTRKFGYAWVPLKRPYEEILVAAMRLRMQYNRSQFLWPARVLYRFAVTRHRIANRSIPQQFPL
jgi:hypothetical protein